MKKSLKFAILIFFSFSVILTIIGFLYFQKPNQYVSVQSKEINSKSTDNLQKDSSNQLIYKAAEDQNFQESPLKEEKQAIDFERNNSDRLYQESQEDTETTSTPALPSSSSIASSEPKSSPSQNQPVVSPPVQKEFATVKIAQLGSFQVDLQDQDNAFTILKRAGMENSFEVKYQWYEGLGAFINCIGGICSQNKNYWVFYYNNQYSLVGASSQPVKAGDIISWEFERK